MQRAPPSRIARFKSLARSGDSSSKPGSQGGFYKPKNFTIRDSNFYDNSHHMENFMLEFAKQTIRGAASDSSERDPPPRCHPETRLAIVERALRFFANRTSKKRLLWLVGAAGVGKSAIMQTLAESPTTPNFTLGASLFFSVNGRDDGSKIILTLAYQLAVKSESYRKFIQDESAKDPTLLDKALMSQFNKFIIEPFAAKGISPEGHERFLILIDGLDECKGQDTQRMILDLISSFCIEYPAAPLVWIIASRPEPHITRFLSQPNVVPCYTKEELEVNDDQSRKDVECYLRNALDKIRAKYEALDHSPHWPAEHDFLKLATAAGGLFAFGQTVVDYIDDSRYGNPESQLEEVLEVIDNVRSREGDGKRHPMASLDALYSRIISKIPQDILNDTKMLLLYTINPPSNRVEKSDFRICCNWLGIRTAAAYGALHHLHSVLGIPSVQDAPSKALEFRHKSFRDYLTDFERSEMFRDLGDGAYQLSVQCATRVLEGVSNARKNGLDPYDGILLSWPPPIEEHKEYKEDQYRSGVQFVIEDLTNQYRSAIQVVNGGLADQRPRYGLGVLTANQRAHYSSSVLSALRLIDIQFSHHIGFDSDYFSQLVLVIFGKDARPELKNLNALKEVSLGTLDMGKVPDWTTMFMSCRSQDCYLAPTPQRCSLGFSHEDKDNLGNLKFKHYWRGLYLPRGRCGCAANILRKLEDRKTHSPEDIVTTFTDITGDYGWVHHTFRDSKHPSLTWDFILPYQF